MGENWIESSWSGLTLEEKLAWLTNNVYWLKVNMDVNDSKFIKMYNELKSNFEEFSLHINNEINDLKSKVDAKNNKFVFTRKHLYQNQKEYFDMEENGKYIINITVASNHFTLGEYSSRSMIAINYDKNICWYQNFFYKVNEKDENDEIISVDYRILAGINRNDYTHRELVYNIYKLNEKNQWHLCEFSDEDAKKHPLIIDIINIDGKEVI